MTHQFAILTSSRLHICKDTSQFPTTNTCTSLCLLTPKISRNTCHTPYTYLPKLHIHTLCRSREQIPEVHYFPSGINIEELCVRMNSYSGHNHDKRLCVCGGGGTHAFKIPCRPTFGKSNLTRRLKGIYHETDWLRTP